MPDMKHFAHGSPSASWAYRNARGDILFYVARYDTSSGKEIVPWSVCQQGKKRQWRQKGHPTPRPLYNLHHLTDFPNKPVLIVEGEKCADAASAILPGYVVTTWPNGAPSVEKADWKPLEGRNIVIWPDNDTPGREAAGAIAEKLRGKAKFRIVRVPEGRPEHWDIADAIQIDKWSAEDILHLIEPSEQEAPKAPFRPLGYDHGNYYFMSGRSSEVISISSANMGKKSLLSLAPLSFWEVEYPGKGGPQWDLASDALIEACSSCGPYDQNRIRGRGAWYDAGRSVLHLGDRLVVDGEIGDVDAIKSKYIYERRPAMGNPDALPARVEDTRGIIDLFSSLSWERGSTAYLAAGWSLIAPICGALDWRPHVWLTGPAGSGKSWVLENLYKPLLGNMAIHALGKSTEAGIRQRLGGDALPVVIDEAESDEKGQADHIQAVLTLMRQSSSEGAGAIFRGTTTGKNMQFLIRSTFLLSSISVNVQHLADESRITCLSLSVNRRKDARETFEKIQRETARLLSVDFCASVRARAISMIPTIRANASTIARAAAIKLGSQRHGDQIGTLLAGAHALISDGKVTPEELEFYMAALDDVEIFSKEVTDEETCLQRILQSQVRVSSTNGFREVTVAELLAIASRKILGNEISAQDADMALCRYGIKYKAEDRHAYFAMQSEGLESLLAKTPWQKSYTRMLRRLVGAEPTDYVRYLPGVRSRATRFDIDVLLKD